MAKSKATYTIQWRPLAENDIENIIDYIALDQLQTAVEFGQQLKDKTIQLSQHPNIGRPARPGLPSYVRELVVHANYIVFYRVMDKERIIEILRVKHTSQQ